MIEHEFEKEKMDSIKALAETNVKIGEARGVLEKLKKDEAVYLDQREKKAIQVVDKILLESKGVLEEATKNYQGVTDLLNTTTSFTEFLSEAYITFNKVVESFEEKSTLWEEEIKKRQEEISKLKQQIDADRVRIKNDQEAVKKNEEKIKIEKIKIADQRATLERAITRLKQGRI